MVGLATSGGRNMEGMVGLLQGSCRGEVWWGLLQGWRNGAGMVGLLQGKEQGTGGRNGGACYKGGEQGSRERNGGAEQTKTESATVRGGIRHKRWMGEVRWSLLP